MKKYTSTQIEPQNNLSTIFAVKKISTLCDNKEFFYAQNDTAKITDKEYKEALIKIENMDTIYFEMTNSERNIYNHNLEIIKNYYIQTK